MAARPDYDSLIAGHTVVIDMINAGEWGLPVLGRLLEVLQVSTDAIGTAFVEYGPQGGRTVAATGAVAWARGRPVPPSEAHPTVLMAGERVRLVPVGSLPADLAAEFTGRGLGPMLVTRVEIGGLLVGSLHTVYPAGPELRAADHERILTYFAACIAHLYGDQNGLPAQGDGRLLAALTEGLAVVDSSGLVQLWNPAATTITGRTAAEVLQQPLPFAPPAPGEVADQQLPNGNWITVTTNRLPGPDGRRIVSFRDITEQYLRAHDRDLFLAMTSHELRTPVTVIKGYADTLTRHWDSLDEAERRRAAEVIGQRAGELARLVDRLLASTDAAEPAAGAVAGSYDLAAALRTAVDELPADLRERIALELPPGLPPVLGDPGTPATVLTELVTNAAKYSAWDTPVRVRAAADERTVTFTVADRGVGIRPEHVERAFDRFWQGESGDRRRFPGTGLGLYLVRRIVERQNGWICLRPRPGGGTVAEVRLPSG